MHSTVANNRLHTVMDEAKKLDESDDNASERSSELKRPDLKGTFRCTICGKVFCHSSSLSRHRMQAHFKTYKCTICRKEILNSESLRSHMYKHHQIARMFMCRCCNWAFADKSLLHMHLNASRSFQQANGILQEPLLVTEKTPSWLANLPKPIPTTIPVFATELEDTSKCHEDSKNMSDSETTCSMRSSLSPECSSTSSFKPDSSSAFYQLSDNLDVSSTTDEKIDCYDCQIYKSKMKVAENKCKYLESRANLLQNEAVEAQNQVANLEHTVHRLRVEAQLLQEHNELFQLKLLECQRLAVSYLQNQQESNAHILLNKIINSTIIA